MRIAIPLGGMRVDCYNASLHIVDIVAQMFVESHSNSCINLVVHRARALHWNISVLLCRQGITLGGKLSQTTTDAETGVAWLDDIVNVAILSCLIRIGEELVVLFLLLGNKCPHILTSFLLGLCLLGLEYGCST